MKFFAATLLSLVALAAARAPLFLDDEGVKGRFVVKIKDDFDVDSVVTHFSNMPDFSRFEGKIQHRFYKVIKGFSARLSDELVELVRGLDAVEYVHQDTVFRTMEVASWGLDRINQRSLPLDNNYESTGDGSNVHVYVIDTGVNIGHVDLAGRVQPGFDAINDDTMDPEYAVDCNGHGSHCAGTVAGTMYGVAKGATIMAVRALGCLGGGTLGNIVAAMDYVAIDGIRPAVASMSLGGAKNPFMDRATQGMIDAGVVVSAAAGNSDADACTFSPANLADAITVGASNINDERAYFSNYGSCVDVFAPGVDITSIWQGESTSTNTISGTSMACPHVSGAAAIVLGNNPEYSWKVVKAAIVNGATEDVITDPVGSPNKLLYVP